MISSNVPNGNSDIDFWVKHAESEILETYGDLVKVKPKSLLKFGRTTNADQNIATTVMNLQDDERLETYVSTNAIDSVSSGSTNDNSAFTLVVEGHTIADGNLTFVTQQVTLNGQTRVALTTPLARVTRAFNNSAGNLTGPVYFYENGAITSGKPNTDSSTHLIIAAGKNQSEKCATAFSQFDYGLITSLASSVSRNNTANVDLELQVRQLGKAFRPQFEWTMRTTGETSFIFEFRPFLIVPKNSDVRINCTASANDTTVLAQFNSLLALVQS